MRDEALSGRGALRASVAVAISLACAFAFATLSLVRFNRAGVVAGIVYLVLGFVWAWVARAPWFVFAWLALVAVVGSFVPAVANHVSLARAYLAAAAFLYALRGDFGLLSVVVALAGLTDMVDGTVARRLATPTSFGGGLDPVVDGLFMAALCVGLSLGGAFPIWLALVVIARYLLPALGGGLLIVLGRRPELRHTLTGQVSTVLILVLVGGVCLLRGLHQPSGALLTGAEVAIPLATLATFVHLAWASRRAVVPAGGG